MCEVRGEIRGDDDMTRSDLVRHTEAASKYSLSTIAPALDMHISMLMSNVLCLKLPVVSEVVEWLAAEWSG